MACVLVQTDGSIVTVATNRPLFTENDSDVHAEIVAIGTACQTGRKTGNATYVTQHLEAALSKAKAKSSLHVFQVLISQCRHANDASPHLL